MSKYTQDLYGIINSLTYDSADKTIYQRIDLALPFIFNFDFPIWSEEYRTTLERKIILHYFKKEICCETFELWQLFLNERLNLIMPYYNKMYLSTIPEFDITKSYNNTSTDTETITDTNKTTDTSNTTNDNTSTSSGTGKVTNSNNTSNNVNNQKVDCDTPQAKINGGDYASFITNVTDTTTQTGSGESDTTNSDSSTSNGTISSTKETDITNTHNKTFNHSDSGNNIPIADLLVKYRDSLINIDNLIIEALHDLFMMIY